MPTPLATLEAEALKLPPEERAALADYLLASLSAERDVDEAWAAEVEHRIAEIEAGRMALVPAEQAIARAKQALA
jgi:putative addiction module component (TIGR02574 family)